MTGLGIAAKQGNLADRKLLREKQRFCILNTHTNEIFLGGNAKPISKQLAKIDFAHSAKRGKLRNTQRVVGKACFDRRHGGSKLFKRYTGLIFPILRREDEKQNFVKRAHSDHLTHRIVRLPPFCRSVKDPSHAFHVTQTHCKRLVRKLGIKIDGIAPAALVGFDLIGRAFRQIKQLVSLGMKHPTVRKYVILAGNLFIENQAVHWTVWVKIPPPRRRHAHRKRDFCRN